MAAISGDSGVIQLSPDDSTYSAVATLSGWSLEMTADTIEVSSMGTNNFKDFIAARYSWSGSCEAHFNDDDTAQEAAETALTGGDTFFYGKFYPGGTSGVDYWSGQMICTGISHSGALGDTVKISLTFQGTGALVRTAG